MNEDNIFQLTDARHARNANAINGTNNGPAKHLAERDARLTAEHEAREAFAAELERRSGGAKGVVIAELRSDDSDLMSDYHGHKTTRTVVIGFSKTPRALFGNMRKAAGTFEETAHLSGAKVSHFEHRENYSMGGGNFLKDGSRHDDGWTVVIRPIEWVTTPCEFAPGTEVK